MMGRLYEPDCELWSCAGSAWARVPTPAATAPRTEVLTKSRREKVMSSSCLWETGKDITPKVRIRALPQIRSGIEKKYRSNRLNYLESIICEESIRPESG